ncbi:hypothetical protein CLAFUW4_14365 [Fulvia fulva]|uniref:RING-type domain-containing protein n=1 Tax=Passalora fulva TaxID=5499 RepID=A0A9Q8PMY3_PASFU|nr:uncharacterized protein CLAFUR5_14196 [Fulvia fulva]KAK4609124.1 hypothetical protein CLAFUR4_14363 [Fulvia fulva]KAK4609663.1 hypothetical protein CLAFUR0_14366 [Fulvia fulva]UJO25354.1 hypothetical protein CLAFUR5_14196 [Fulvia fulva]WPV22866.1 hypothetical protein CLAFUW4_14365 [Fulvia fulva]WPV37500.1 hypothetical protein CLAFUW7_14371 [Fulvia fulva]
MSNPASIPNKALTSSNKAPQLSSSSQISPALSSTQQFFSNDSSARRSGSGNTGASRSPAPRNNQTSKAKHKPSKRFRSLDEDAEAEAFSMQNPHGRRGQQSITHLMQFALPPRPNAQQQYHRHSYNGPRRNGGGNRTWGMGSGYHAGDKARYVHANYRFVVDPRGDYAQQAQDADVHLDWNNVLQVIASSTTQTASCPICLGEPTAPRMAKCGHIFCLPCLIRYMHSEDGAAAPPDKKARWKKCPICWDSIYVTETRPVRWYVGQENEQPREGGDFVLRLVKRKPGSTLAMPRESADTVPKGESIPWYFAAEVMDYARVMKGSEEYMLQQYDETLKAIELLEKEDELMFGEDAEWTGRAIRMLKESKEKVKGIGNPPAQPKKPEAAPAPEIVERPPIEFNESDEGVPDMYLQKQAATPSPPNIAIESIAEGQEAASTESTNYVPRTIHEMRQRQTEKPQPNEYLFYHGLQHYYLSPLDIRILKSAFGSYHSLPSSILPRIERVSSGHVVDDDLRKRVKYLAHLPYGCEVAFLECDWRDVVSASVLEEFKPMLDRRRKRHEEKETREEKDRIRIEKASERELASIRRQRRPSIPDTDGFFTSSLPASIVEVPGEALGAGSPPWPTNADRPGFGSLASPSTSPSMPRTVWGTSAVAPGSPDMHATLPNDSAFRHGEDDGWLQDWERDLLDQQQQQQVLAESMDGLNIQASKPSGGGKKGKKNKKKITLMSTANGARRGA